MISPQPDHRSTSRRTRDEAIAAEPPMKQPSVPNGVTPTPVEAHLAKRRHHIAVEGVVENGIVRPLDPKVKLPENSRVIIVAAEEA